MAVRYWVGGTGTWNSSSTANWAATSGGASGASAPVAADSVFFDANSGTGTCTTSGVLSCATINMTSTTLGLTLGANLTLSGVFTLSAGTLSLQSFIFSSLSITATGTTARTIAFGTGSMTLTGNATSVWNADNMTNFTVTGTPTVNATYSGATGTRTLNFGNAGAPGEANTININITAGTDTVAMYGNGMRDVNFTGFAGTWSATGTTKTLYGSLTLSSGMTLAAGIGTITFAATSGTKTITSNGQTIEGSVTFNGVGGTFQLQDNLTAGSTRTTTLANGTLDLNGKTLSTGAFSSSTSNARTLAFGTGSITLTGSNATIWSTSTATNLVVTGTPTVNSTYSGSVGTRLLASGFTAGGSAANSISFNITAGSDLVSLYGFLRDVNFTGFSGSWSSSLSKTVYGNFTLSTDMTLAATTTPLTFGGTSGTQTITTNGRTVDWPLIFDGVGGTFQFADALAQGSTRAFTITNGIVRLKAGTTNTVGSFTTGAGTTQRFLQSDTPGTRATITDPSGTNTATYLTIRDIAATGGATWQAFLSSNNVDMGNNVGWDFNSLQIGRYMYNVRKSKRVLP